MVLEGVDEDREAGRCAILTMTQKEKILDVLLKVRSGDHDIPEEYIRKHPDGDGISSRYFKQVMLISECNGRISELRSQGHDVQTSKVKDVYGFVYHRLPPEGKTVAELEKMLSDWFDGIPHGRI